MKAQMEFELPGEKNEHRDAFHATDYKLIIQNIEKYLCGLLDKPCKDVSGKAANEMLRVIKQIKHNQEVYWL